MKEVRPCNEFHALTALQFYSHHLDLVAMNECMLLYASMDGLPELERRYIDYRYGFATGKHMPRSAVAKILGVPEAEAKRIEADARNYLRGCFHVDSVNVFYELRPEAAKQKALAQESYEALFDNLDRNCLDSLLAQFEEDD